MSIALPRVAALSAALLSAIACNDGDGARTRSAESDAAEPATSDDAGLPSSDGATSSGMDASRDDASANDVSVEPARDANAAGAPDVTVGSALPDAAAAADGAAPATASDAATADASTPGASTDASSAPNSDAAAVANDAAVTAWVCSGDRWAMDVASAAAVGECGSITGNLAVAGTLTELVLPRLTSIGGYVTIFATPALTRIELPALTRIGGFLDISGNELLRSIALPALRTVNDRAMSAARDVAVRENPMLPGCQAEQLRAQLMNAGFDGSIDVSNNGPGCRP